MPIEPVKVKKTRKPKKQKVKQGHKLVWLTLIIILIPVAIVGYVLMSSMESQGKPVEGSRFSENALQPEIQQKDLDAIQSELMNIEGVESATMDMKSATLRIHLNMQDGFDDDGLTNAAEAAYGIVNNVLPIDTYFTNSNDSKNYDLEIDSYNFLVDADHPIDGQRYIKILKTGASGKVIDNMRVARNQELTDQVRR
ncbi:hypothetical protein [Ileibacterium valens]|uniref:hypothetical protein n=1 Tax=Ileibacterium valens TaxID=1862668 RepID=UPI002572B1D8|nr:hypothetical protein [Ileibacterium valens]